jgi:hypothetical protein
VRATAAGSGPAWRRYGLPGCLACLTGLSQQLIRHVLPACSQETLIVAAGGKGSGLGSSHARPESGAPGRRWRGMSHVRGGRSASGLRCQREQRPRRDVEAQRLWWKPDRRRSSFQVAMIRAFGVAVLKPGTTIYQPRFPRFGIALPDLQQALGGTQIGRRDRCRRGSERQDRSRDLGLEDC